ncbi:hypothetical protein KJ765_02730 [Candidatus Micrarchaeota archaeon]|nr:hypothetical protein [Candidatus Micrarchaeota archaeon]
MPQQNPEREITGRREYEPVYRALHSVYLEEQRLRRTVRDDPRKSISSMWSAINAAFKPLEKRHGKIILPIRSQLFHFEERPPNNQVLFDYEQPLHGIEKNESIDPEYGLRLARGIAEIGAWMAMSRIRASSPKVGTAKGMKGKQVGQIKKITREDPLSIISQIRDLVERRKHGSRFDAMVAMARHQINQHEGRSGPERIHSVRMSPYEPTFASTGYRKVLDFVREIKKPGKKDR